MNRMRFLAIAAPIVSVAAAAPRPVADLAPRLTDSFISRVEITDPNDKTTDRVAMSGHASVLGDRAPQSVREAGFSYDFVVRLDRTGHDGKTSGGVGLSGHASLLGDHVRIDFDSQHAPPGMTSAYFVSNDAGAHAVIVSTSRHQAMEMPMAALVRRFSNSSGNFGGLLNQATDVHIDVQDIGARPEILGQPTAHYRFIEGKTINGKVSDAGLHERDSVTIDLYYAPGLKNFINPFVSEPIFAGGLDGLGPEDRQMYVTARSKLHPGLAPLRAVTTETITDAHGKVITNVVTAMVTRLKSGEIEPSLFDVPEGYAKSMVQEPL